MIRDQLLRELGKMELYKLENTQVIKKTAQELMLDAIKEESTIKDKALDLLKDHIKPIEPIIPIDPIIVLNKEIYLNIDTYINDFIQSKRDYKISESSIKSYRSAFRYFKYFINEDTQFNFRFFKEVQSNFKKIPKNFFKYHKYYKKSLKEVLESKEDFEVLNPKTINIHMLTFNMLFEYLAYIEVIEHNPLIKLKTIT